LAQAQSQVSRKNYMPVLYIPHGGGPCFFMEWTMGPRDTWDGMKSWLMNLASTLPVKPRAIIVISAHWEEPIISISNAKRPNLLYDYYGFPEDTYRLEYQAPGSPELAHRANALLNEHGIKSQFEEKRGLDHGVFIPLKLIYPEADIPIVQISLKQGLDPASHIEFGRALAPLRKEDVLILSSGLSYHNLRSFGTPEGIENSIAFDNWLLEAVSTKDSNERNRQLKDWKHAPSALSSHPREEHLIPLMVAAGAAETDTAERIYSERVMGLAISGFQFG